jgi:SAM-dependent methyltransferase
MRHLLSRIQKRLFPKNTNTVGDNFKTWSEWNWSRNGEEWSNSPQWKESFLKHVLHPNVTYDADILEIGPGAGRWTEALLLHAKELTLVDLTPKCIELCKERFKAHSNIRYFVNDGKDLGFIAPNSMDCIWSFDVFVHISYPEVEEYVRQFALILRPGARAIIHHSKNGQTETGWRSNMTAAKMKKFCGKYGLSVARQFDSWDNDKEHVWPGLPPHAGPDVVSVLVKPAH